MIALGTRIEQVFARKVHPVIVADDLHAGSGGILAAEVDAQTIMDNYHFDLFSWHRVTCYGDHRTACLNLAHLYGMKIYEEDRNGRPGLFKL